MPSRITSSDNDSDPGASRLMTQREVADELRVGLRTLARWRSIGFGPPFCQLWRGIRYQRREVEDWIASRERHPIPAEQPENTMQNHSLADEQGH